MNFNNTISFLKLLNANNNRDWFHDNNVSYQIVKKEFEQFIANFIPELYKVDSEIGILNPKQCSFRINRDIRFSKDKSPYKNHLGVYFAKGGRNSIYAGYYIHLQPGNSFIGGGVWMPEPPVLKSIRQEIYYNIEEYKEIIYQSEFKKYYTEFDGNKLINAPKDFPKDFPDIELLKNKNFVFGKQLSDAELDNPSLIPQLLDAFKVLMPYNHFLNRAIEDVSKVIS